MIMRKILTTAFITAALCILSGIYASADALNVYVDSSPVEFNEDTGTPFFDENDRTMTPLRAVMEAFGAKVSWNEETSSAVLEKDGKSLTVTVGSKTLKLDDGTSVTMDSVPVETGGRIYLPIRAAAEALGGYVLWNEQLSSVFILSDSYTRFRDMFTYSGELSKYVDAVVVSATYSGEMSREEFKDFWTDMGEEKAQTLLRIIATDKQGLNPEHDIHINFWYLSKTGDEKDCLIASVSSFSYEASIFNPFEQTEINQLNQ